MDTYEPFLSLGLALAAGFLIGQEREYSAPDARAGKESFIGGSRTYPLVSLAGAASVLVARQFGPWLMLVALAAVGALLVVSYAGDVRAGRSHGLTSEVALLLSFLLGALALTTGVLEPARVKGLVVTGLIGGLVSSTAVTLSFSGRAKGAPRDLSLGCTLAVLLASSLMFARVLVEVAVVHPPLLRLVAVPMGAMALTLLGASAFLYRQGSELRGENTPVEFANPFALGSALTFTLLFAGVLLGAKAATEYLGSGGAYLAGVLAGLTDVDAITLTMAKLAQGGALPEHVAVTTLFLGTAANTLTKGVMATAVGGWGFGRRVLGAFGVTLVVGAGALAVTHWP
jgi:uncharacterized membrane protein (DUF4010 family)